MHFLGPNTVDICLIKETKSIPDLLAYTSWAETKKKKVIQITGPNATQDFWITKSTLGSLVPATAAYKVEMPQEQNVKNLAVSSVTDVLLNWDCLCFSLHINKRRSKVYIRKKYLQGQF